MSFSEWFYEKAEDISNEDRYYFDSFKNEFNEAYTEGYKEAEMMIQSKFAMLQDELERLKK